jgi:hypothetical protein
VIEVRLFQTSGDAIQTAVEVRFNAICIYYCFGNNNIVESSDRSATVPTSGDAIQTAVEVRLFRLVEMRLRQQSKCESQRRLYLLLFSKIII